MKPFARVFAIFAIGGLGLTRIVFGGYEAQYSAAFGPVDVPGVHCVSRRAGEPWERAALRALEEDGVKVSQKALNQIRDQGQFLNDTVPEYPYQFGNEGTSPNPYCERK
ncbi:hypothetical protein HY357_02135 [Candidatus Roizmanbacteria bacterium]|nr:hypothetical protein [Candidatus Roizmanbacteria bacterium]